MSKPRCVAVVEMISKFAISNVSVDPRHLCRLKERNLRRRSVLPIKWRTRISIVDTLCLPGIKFRAAVRTIRGAFKSGYKGVKSDSYWYARRTNIYESVENDTDLWCLARLNPIPSHVASRRVHVALLAVNCLFNIPQKRP